MKLSPKTEALFAATRPRQFDLTDEDERERLLRETVEYAKVSLHYGTDDEGRRLAYGALRNAFASGYRLVKMAS